MQKDRHAGVNRDKTDKGWSGNVHANESTLATYGHNDVLMRCYNV